MKQQIMRNKCSHQRDTIKIASESMVRERPAVWPREARQTLGHEEACKGQVIPSRVYNKPKRMWSAYVFDFVLVPPTAAPWETVLCGAAPPHPPKQPTTHPSHPTHPLHLDAPPILLLLPLSLPALSFRPLPHWALTVTMYLFITLYYCDV